MHYQFYFNPENQCDVYDDMYVHVCMTTRINSKTCTITKNRMYPVEGPVLKASVAPFTRDISCVCSLSSYAVDAGRCKHCSPSNGADDEEPDQCWSSGRSEQSRVHSPKT
jgi:hypothetical protein